MSAGFTSTPWKVESRHAFGDGEVAVEPASGNGGRVIALCYGTDAEANARLIAAAPSLYNALAQFVALLDAGEGSLSHELEYAMRDALAKAGIR